MMSHPAFQAGIAPFLIGFITALAFIKESSQRRALAIVVGFAVTAYLSIGFNFQSLSSSRKIILLGLLSPFMVYWVEKWLITPRSKWMVISILPGIAVLWVLWPILVNQDSTMLAVLSGLGYVLFMTSLVLAFYSQRNNPASITGSAVLVLGIGVAICALVGASALLGQLAGSVAAAGGGLLLLYLLFFEEEPPAGSLLGFSAALISGLAICAAIEYAEVPWTVLPLLAVIPWLSRIPLSDEWWPVVRIVCWSSIMLIPAGIAIYLTWLVAGDVPF